jgi:hypothetical protein
MWTALAWLFLMLALALLAAAFAGPAGRRRAALPRSLDDAFTSHVPARTPTRPPLGGVFPSRVYRSRWRRVLDAVRSDEQWPMWLRLLVAAAGVAAFCVDEFSGG